MRDCTRIFFLQGAGGLFQIGNETTLFPVASGITSRHAWSYIAMILSSLCELDGIHPEWQPEGNTPSRSPFELSDQMTEKGKGPK